MGKFTKDNLRNTFSAIFSDQQIDNINKMYSYLKDTLHWSDKNIAAVLGNILLESSFNYGSVSKIGATGPFLMTEGTRKEYNEWKMKNGYKDGPLSLATFFDYKIQNKVDPRYDSFLNAHKLLLNKNHTDSVNANVVLKDWGLLEQWDNGTFYPIYEYTEMWNDPRKTLGEITEGWSNYIERAGSQEKNNSLRVKYANNFYNIITSQRLGGKINYLKFFK